MMVLNPELLKNGISYRYRYGTTNENGILALGDNFGDKKIISAIWYEGGSTNGYVIPYYTGGNWYFKIFDYNGNTVRNTYVGVMFFYVVEPLFNM